MIFAQNIALENKLLSLVPPCTCTSLLFSIFLPKYILQIVHKVLTHYF